jgi:predicted nucleotidyltransferase
MATAQVLSTHARIGDQHEHQSLRGSDDAVFAQVLADAARLLEEGGLDYVVMGGLGFSSLGQPRWTHDIDFFLRPDEAQDALEVLGKNGFRTEETDPWWLYKAFRQDVMVDLIFRSAGDIYLDAEMMEHASMRDFDGASIRVISPEDLIVIKAVATSEASPYHFYDALGIISACELDWEYLISRVRRGGLRRLLSLLLFAQSNDLDVPTTVLKRLTELVLE